MYFEELIFYVSLVAILIISKLCSEKNRWLPLLFFSLVFIYSLNGIILLVFIALACLNYLLLNTLKVNHKLKFSLVVINLCGLFYFKYLKFLLPQNPVPMLSILQPVGISYFVFEQLSFIIDFKHGQRQYHLGHYLASSLFFAKFISGPIERLKEFTGQFLDINQSLDGNIRAGALLIYRGLFKKLVIANNFNYYTSIAFNLKSYDREALIISILMNKYEIWANFSGYTDIARGTAKILGLNLSENFTRPFNSETIREFWKKWHLSLSQWIRDYVFYPLAVTPFSRFGVFPITLITFIVFAFWHDIKITLFVYACIQAILIYISIKTSPYIENRIGKVKNKLALYVIRAFRISWTYIILLSIPGVLFRVNDLDHVVYIFDEILNNRNTINSDMFTHQNTFIKPIFFVVAAIVLFELVEMYKEKFDLIKKLKEISFLKEALFYYFAILLLIFLASFNQNVEFIYGNY